MNPSPLEYLQSLVAPVPALNETLARSLQNWGAEAPPIIVVFAEIGHAIAENIAVLPSDVRRKIFSRIEDGMVSQDSGLKEAIATGLVEALVGSADKKEALWTDLQNLLGPESKRLAMAWREFGR